MTKELDAVKPALEPGVLSVALSADEVRFETNCWGGPSHTLRDEEGDGVLWRLVELLDGSRTVGEAAAEFRGVDEREIRNFVVALFEWGVVYDAADPAHRYARLCSAETGEQTRERFHEFSSLLVVGDGTLGTLAATALDDAGIEGVTFVRPSGSPEEEPSASGVPDGTRTDSDESIPSLVSDADFAVVATERPRPELHDEVNRAAQSSETPWLSARASGSEALVGPIVVPGTTACYECYRTRSAANAPDAEVIDTVREGDAAGSVPFGLRHVLLGVALDALGRFVCYRDERLFGHVVRFDLRNGAMETENVLPVPSCPVCSPVEPSATTVPTLADGGGDD